MTFPLGAMAHALPQLAVASDSDEAAWDNRPSSERWAPVGAVASPSSSTTTEDRTEDKSFCELYPDATAEELEALKQENEQMANSLLSLTSHFAQVQFRLKQVVATPEEEREKKLKELEEFSERGIPDIKSCVVPTKAKNLSEDEADEEYQKKLTESQKTMITDLKVQLEDLEKYAYQSGFADDIPTVTKIEKQEVIIGEIRKQLQIANLENIGELSAEQLREIVIDAIAQIVNPAKAKEKVLDQLKTQVVDLERFVDFLQAEVTQATSNAAASVNTSNQVRSGPHTPDYSPFGLRTQGTGSSERSNSPTRADESTASRLKRIVNVLHLFIISELGCAGRKHDMPNNMKDKSTEPHFGDTLARMQMSIDNLIIKAEQAKVDHDESVLVDCDYTSDEETYISENKQLTQCVRKEFTVSLKNLIEHGLIGRSQSRAILPFMGCASRKSVLMRNAAEHMHAWHIILQYYELKNGKEYNNSPPRKLADSFGIDAVNGQSVTVKQTLLSAIGHVIETHTPYQRSDDSHFKAFVCLGLNQKKLVPWLRQVFRTSPILDRFYEPWSYARKSGFEDVFCTMNKLKLYDFNLPVDLAVKQFSMIKDAF